MHFYKAFGLNIHSEISLPELSAGDPDAEIDLFIKKGGVTLPHLTPTRIFRRGVEASFGQDQDGNLYLHWDNIGSFEAIDGSTLIVSPVVVKDDVISLFTVSEPLGLILFQKGYFLLHSSSVRVRDEAWCFMGDPGAGKSTTAAAFIKAGCDLISDDLTAISFDQEGVPYVIPAYPQLKMWSKTVNGLDYDPTSLQPVSEGIDKFAYQPASTFSQEKVRLGKIFFLHKARNRKSLLPLHSGQIPSQMLKNFPLPIALLKQETLKRHFFQSLQCGKFAEIWQKKRPEGFDNLQRWIAESISQLANTMVND